MGWGGGWGQAFVDIKRRTISYCLKQWIIIWAGEAIAS